MFCVTVYAAYIHQQVKSPGYPSQKTEIRTNSVNCTTATGYATFHRTVAYHAVRNDVVHELRSHTPQEPSRVAHSGLCTLVVMVYSFYAVDRKPMFVSAVKPHCIQTVASLL